MIRGAFPDAGEQTPAELRAAYEAVLAETVERVGVEAVLENTDLDRETVESLTAGDSPTITLEEAAAILALDEERPSAGEIAAEARDVLLLGMTTAVLDVETLSSGVDGALEPKEIQQKVEGRYPMTLQEYATLHRYIAQRSG